MVANDTSQRDLTDRIADSRHTITEVHLVGPHSVWNEPIMNALDQAVKRSFLRQGPQMVLKHSKQYSDMAKESDMAIICETRVLRARKTILCKYSDVLATAFKPAWSSSMRPEVDDPAILQGIDSVIEHSISGARPVKQMIEYMYTGAFKIYLSQAELATARAVLGAPIVASRYCMMLACIELRIVADFYLVEKLVRFVESFFRQLVEKTRGITKSSLFVNLIKKVMTDTPQEGDMVAALLRGACLHLRREDFDFLHQGAQECREVVDFTFMLLKFKTPIPYHSDSESATSSEEEEDEEEEDAWIKATSTTTQILQSFAMEA